MTVPAARPTGWGDPVAVAPSPDDVRAAARRLAGRVERTRLTPFNDRILLKDETVQPTGSFKVRGVLNWTRSLSGEERSRGFSTFSAGNTALALGYAARMLGTSCRSLLPDYAPGVKVEALAAAGVETRLVPFSEMAGWLFSASWKHEPWAFLHPWAEPLMIAGHATIGLELAEDLPDVKTVYVPVGGGALIAGVASALKALKTGVRVIAVQTESYPALRESFALGRPTWVEHEATICDGVAVPFTTDQMFPLLRLLVDRVVVVSEAGTRQAVRRLWLEAGIRAEGAGALALAAALADDEPGPAVCLVTGANIEPELHSSIVGLQ